MTPDEREHYDERAAIAEYDGHLSRADAETQAMKAVEAKRKDIANRFLWGQE